MKIVVITSVFPNQKQPTLGVFVRERMFRVAQHCEMKVVAPVPWFPFAGLLKKDYRPAVPFREFQDGIEVLHPKFFNIPRWFKWLDGFFFSLCAAWTVHQLRKEFDFDLIDAHFVYPDGMGAVLLGKLFRRPVTITVRGTLRKFLPRMLIRPQLRFALQQAAWIFTVCADLREAAIDAGAPPERVEVVANGVNIDKFRPVDRQEARKQLGLPLAGKIIISVGGLVERKGFHRVLEVLPELGQRHPDLHYLIVGGPSVEGNFEPELRRLTRELDLGDKVFFAGAQRHEELFRWLSAADVFCLATSNEGWANVFLEAMACGLPVVTTRVGGNAEVVSGPTLGLLTEFGVREELARALEQAIEQEWDRSAIIRHAAENGWDRRVETLLERFQVLAGGTTFISRPEVISERS
jgi:glycosyltransferase involved in cell wall biosynthesis